MAMDLAGIELPQITPSTSGESVSRQITDYRRNLHSQLYEPLLEQTIGQIGQSGMVDAAKERAQTDPAQLQARMDRQQSRMGSNMSVAAQQYQRKSMGRQSGLRGVHNVNSARIAEDEYDQAARRSAINYGTGMLGNAQQGAQASAQVEAGIRAQNDQGQAANNAAWVGVGSTIIGGALSI
jgi:hypothetical protein